LGDTVNKINYPKELSIQTVCQLDDYIHRLNPMDSQGVIAISESGEIFKAVSPMYRYLANIRGNTSSLLLRYLELTDNTHIQVFNYLYPTEVEQLAREKWYIQKVCLSIHMAYINRFVKKMYVVVPKNHYRIISKCHCEYLNTKIPVTPQKIYNTALSFGIDFLKTI
jgi:hypothetical protein